MHSPSLHVYNLHVYIVIPSHPSPVEDSSHDCWITAASNSIWMNSSPPPPAIYCKMIHRGGRGLYLWDFRQLCSYPITACRFSSFCLYFDDKSELVRGCFPCRTGTLGACVTTFSCSTRGTIACTRLFSIVASGFQAISNSQVIIDVSSQNVHDTLCNCKGPSCQRDL